jgi:hypothetical protein
MRSVFQLPDRIFAVRCSLLESIAGGEMLAGLLPAMQSAAGNAK